jgi:hypothetical protein
MIVVVLAVAVAVVVCNEVYVTKYLLLFSNDNILSTITT